MACTIQFMKLHVCLSIILLLNLGGLSSAAALPQTAAPLTEGKPFVVFWNAPTLNCQKLKIPLDFNAFYSVSTPQAVPNQTLTLLYAQRLGLIPYANHLNSQQYNGGIPQNGNLNASLTKFKAEVTQYVSNSTSGLAVLDWEEWFPVYDRNVNERNIYRVLSINNVLKQEPSLGRIQAINKARVQFEKAAQDFMQETLKLGVSMRPKTLWGYYLFPSCYNYNFKTKKYTGQCTPSAFSLNNKLQWLWNISTALFPSAYMLPSISGSPKAAPFVRNQVLEAMRVAALSPQNYTTPVYLYLRPVMRRAKEHNKYMADLIYSIGESAAVGSAGAVLWGASADYNKKASCNSLSQYLSNYLNPYIVNVTTAAQLCSNQICQGKGRCVRKNTNSSDYLHLNTLNFSIQKINGTLQAIGNASSNDIAGWANKFTCQCYKDQNCPS